MWPKQFTMSQAFYTGLLGVLCVLRSLCQAADSGLCGEGLTGEQTTITCACLSNNDTMILQDLRISSNGNNNRSSTLPNDTMLLTVGGCHAVHLSGPTLTSLLHLHTLHLHDIDELHVSYDFFLQYETQLQVLKLSSAGFAPLQDSLNIHAHKLSHILLDKIIWDGELNLLLQTSEDGLPEVLAITNSRITILGEINLSSRYVRRLVLQNNTINLVLSALMQDSQETLIENNCIGNLSFLSLDSNTQHFTLQGNTINWLALKSLNINATNEIAIVNNKFFHIEKYALTWLRVSDEGGSLVFSGNHLYAHEEGSLAFYSKVIDKNHLKIESNTVHTETCDCSALEVLDTMTSRISLKHKRLAYELFEDSSFCSDKDGKMTKFTDICKTHSRQNMGRALLIFAIVAVSVVGLSILLFRSRKREVPYKTLHLLDIDE